VARDTLPRLQSAGLGLFSEQWYEIVSVAEICRRAGVSNGAFYRYFPGKEELNRSEKYEIKVRDWTQEGIRPFVRSLNRIRRANLDGSELQIILTCADHAGNSYDLAIHDGHLYWTDWLTRSINRADLDGGNVVEGVVSDIDSPVGLAIDHVAGKFYWVSDRDKSLRRANLDGSGVETIVSGVSNPYGVALNYDPSSLPVEDFVRIRGVSFSGPETIDISALARPGKPFVLESTGSLLSPFKDHAGAAQTSQPDGSLSWTVSVGQARQAYFRVRARDSGP